MKGTLLRIYDTMLSAFGPQQWWPGDGSFEVMVGAILTQNTNWGNVERALENLKSNLTLTPEAIYSTKLNHLAKLIKPAGYFNVKARRLKAFVDYFFHQYAGKVALMKKSETASLRKELLTVNGIGPETADSILLYALEKPVFVIDAYTKRVLSRHGIMGIYESYDTYQNLFHRHLSQDVSLYNEYHALFVRLGKEFCRPSPRCEECPLKEIAL